MEAFIVYEKGKRPWPDEVTLLTETEMRESVLERLAEKVRKLNSDELTKLAEQYNIIVDNVS